MADNLDAVINKISFEIVSKKIVDEKQINKMIGVLANDGVYALWVFLNDKLKLKSMDFWKEVFSKDELGTLFKSINFQEAKKITYDRLSEIEAESNYEKKKNFFNYWQQEISTEFFHKLSNNLSDLLFFREILEKILIYARYHAKAMGDDNE